MPTQFNGPIAAGANLVSNGCLLGSTGATVQLTITNQGDVSAPVRVDVATLASTPVGLTTIGPESTLKPSPIALTAGQVIVVSTTGSTVAVLATS